VLKELTNELDEEEVESFIKLDLSGALLADALLSALPHEGKSDHDPGRMLVGSAGTPPNDTVDEAVDIALMDGTDKFRHPSRRSKNRGKGAKRPSGAADEGVPSSLEKIKNFYILASLPIFLLFLYHVSIWLTTGTFVIEAGSLPGMVGGGARSAPGGSGGRDGRAPPRAAPPGYGQM